jgi:hypothetical protein
MIIIQKIATTQYCLLPARHSCRSTKIHKESLGSAICLSGLHSGWHSTYSDYWRRDLLRRGVSSNTMSWLKYNDQEDLFL